MSGRASIFEKPKPKVDVSGFAPRAEAEARPRPEDLEELTRGSKFRSREGNEPEPVRVHQRRRRTGRNVQFNIRATQQVIDEFKALSEEMDWPDGLTLEKALAALKFPERTRTGSPPAFLLLQELDDRGIITPAAIGEVLGMPTAEAIKLLSRHQWRQGDVALLKAAAARLGLKTKTEGDT